MITTTFTDFFLPLRFRSTATNRQNPPLGFPFVVEHSLASLGGRLASLSSDAKQRLATSKQSQATRDKKGKTPQDEFGLLRFWFFKVLISWLIVNSYLHFIVYQLTIWLKHVTRSVSPLLFDNAMVFAHTSTTYCKKKSSMGDTDK